VATKSSRGVYLRVGAANGTQIVIRCVTSSGCQRATRYANAAPLQGVRTVNWSRANMETHQSCPARMILCTPSWRTSSLISSAQRLWEYCVKSLGASFSSQYLGLYASAPTILTVLPYPRQSGAITRRPISSNMGI